MMLIKSVFSLLMIAFCSVELQSLPVFAAEEAQALNKQERSRLHVRQLLEAGKKAGKFPEGYTLRLNASLQGVRLDELEAAKARGEKFEESFEETWEFTATEVYHLVYEPDENKKYTFRKVESRPFDSRKLCEELLEGQFLEIGTGKGTGERMQFVGTHFCAGGRSIDLFIKDEPEPLIDLVEHCTFAGYPASDARLFATLYEKLAKQGRNAFNPIKESQP